MFFVSHIPISSLQTPETFHSRERIRVKAAGVFPNIILQPVMVTEKSGHLCYWALLLMLQIISQSTSTKTLSSLCCLKGDRSPHLGRTQTPSMAKYSLTHTLQRVCSSDGVLRKTNLFGWSLSLWRGCKCYLFSIKNTAGAICLAQALAHFPDAFCADHFTWQFAKIFHSLVWLNITFQNGLFSPNVSKAHKWMQFFWTANIISNGAFSDFF